MNLIDRFETMWVLGPRGTCGISLEPETYTEGGSLLDDVDVQFLALKFVVWDYGKADQKSAPFLKINMLPEGTTDVHIEYMKCGELDAFTPSPDGETLIDVQNRGSINKTSNAAMFLTSLVNAGVVGKLSSGKISDLVGIKCHVVRTKRPKDNIKRDAGAKEPTVLTVSRLISTPWDSTVPSGASTISAKSVATVAQSVKAVSHSSNGSSVFGDAELGMLVVQVLTEAGGSLPKITLVQEVFKAGAAGAIPADAKDESGKPARYSAPNRINTDAFLESQPYWRYDGATVTLQ